jgi:hypothetical protein
MGRLTLYPRAVRTHLAVVLIAALLATSCASRRSAGRGLLIGGTITAVAGAVIAAPGLQCNGEWLKTGDDCLVNALQLGVGIPILVIGLGLDVAGLVTYYRADPAPAR